MSLADSSCSKLGEAPRKSAAAYLLFYRRRSDKPLGPPSLQQLVEDFHNPPQQTNSADEAYESDAAGEGRPGDPSSTLRGSSGHSVGAGVGALTGTPAQSQSRVLGVGAGSGSAGRLAGEGLNMKSLGTNSSDDDEGIGMDEDDLSANAAPPRACGPERPSHMRQQYAGVNPPAWGFESLDQLQNPRADSDAEMLLDNVGDNNEYDRNEEDDAGSMTAELDADHDDGFEEDRRLPEFLNPKWNDNEDSFTLGDSWDGFQDDHAMYSDAHGQEALHLPDAGEIGDESDPPVKEINLDDGQEQTHLD